MLVWGDCRPPPTPTNKTSDLKVLRHPFRDHGLPLPRRRWAQRNNRLCCPPGRRQRPCAPDSGGGPLCMPLCFWATQTAVAALGLFWGTGGQNLHPTSLPNLLPQVSNTHTAFMLSKKNIVSCLVSVVPTPHAQAAPTLLTSLLPNKTPTTASN
jgi:hypothetical protein